MSNYPDNMDYSKITQTAAQIKAEDAANNDAHRVDRIYTIIDSFIVELGYKPTMENFHKSKAVRLEEAYKIARYIESDKVKERVTEALDAWAWNEEPIEDLPIKDFGTSFFHDLYMKVMEGEFDESYMGDQ